MDELFSASGGEAGDFNIGSALSNIASSYFGYRAAQSNAAIRWTPYGNGQMLGVGPGGQYFVSGAPGVVPATTTGSWLLIGLIGLLVVGAFVAFKR